MATVTGVALALMALGGTAAASPGTGAVGGPPAIELGQPDEGRQTSPALVIGLGSTLGRPTQLVAYGWKPEPDSEPANFCVWIERPPKEVEFGDCGAALDEESSLIAIDTEAQDRGRRWGRSTAVGGRVAPGVTAVRLYFHRSGSARRHRVVALVAQVDGDLQQRLKQPVPFGFFYARVRGIVAFDAFRAQALDSAGHIVGTATSGLA